MTQTALILGGSGKIGHHSADAFRAAGWQVRLYRRGTDMTTAAMGADVIVNGLNPPNYHNWAKTIPAITRDVVAAAKASGATVILPGNIYTYGSVTGRIDETTPQRATTRKGRVRIEMEAAYRASGVRTIVLRAGNFIDPLGNGDLMSFMVKGLAKGKVMSFGRPEARNAYAYVPDWARAAVMLAERRESLPVFADIPFPGHAFSGNDLRDHLSARLGRTLRLTRFPWWAMTVTAPVWELAREMTEMRYLYDMDHWIGAERLVAVLPDFVPTPRDVVMSAGLPGAATPAAAPATA